MTRKRKQTKPNRVTRSINVNKENWERLGEKCSNRSEWVNQQLEHFLNVTDDIEELEIELRRLEEKERKIRAEKAIIKEQIEKITIERERNSQEYENIEKAMYTIRIVNEKEGVIGRDRVIFIANRHHITQTALERQIYKENIEIKDIDTI